MIVPNALGQPSQGNFRSQYLPPLAAVCGLPRVQTRIATVVIGRMTLVLFRDNSAHYPFRYA